MALAIVLLLVFVGSAFAQPPQTPATDDAAAPSEKAATPPAPQPSADDEKPPQYDEMELPTMEQLLSGRPVDWIVLKTQGVIVAEPVQPRPNTLATLQARIDAMKRPADRADLEAWLAERDALTFLTLTLPRESDEELALEYRLPVRFVDRILHHEDLMLRRIDKLMDEGRQRDAFEMLFLLERKLPDWPGIADRRSRLLLLEGAARLEDGRPEAALIALEELHARQADYPRLSTELGRVIDRLIGDAVAAEDFHRARHFLGRLTRMAAQHPVAADWKSKLLARAEGLLEEARVAASGGRHDAATHLADRAAAVWPLTPGLAERHRRFGSRFQTLRVGVVRLAGDAMSYPLRADAERRETALTSSRLFEIRAFGDAARYDSGWFEEWEPADLGRRADFSLRPSRPTWQSQPVLTAAAIANSLAARLDSGHPAFDERLAAHVDAVSVQSPYQFSIRFARVPLRLESLLAMPVEAGSEADAAGRLLSQRFVVHERTDDRAIYRRSRPEPDQTSRHHLAEVIEQRYATHDEAVQALLRGQVSMLPQVQPWDVNRLQADSRFFVQRYGVPATHVLQFHPRNELLRSRELRRALAYALDPQTVLDEVVLRGAPAGRGRLATSPFPTQSHAYDAVVAPRAPDLSLAISLGLAAKKQNDGKLPVLRLACDPDPIARAAARALIGQWQRAGIAVQLVEEEAAADPAEWDLLYRIVRMTEPALDLWPFLTLEDRARIESLQHLPDWLRQELISLEQAGDWNTATAILKRLHEHLAADVQLIPLWEVDDFYVLRKNVRGFPADPVMPYQGIEQWIVDPWFSTEAP